MASTKQSLFSALRPPSPQVLNRQQVFTVFFTFCLAVLLLSPATLFAQSDTTASGEAVDARSEISADEVNEIARSLWCPLCSGVRLDACELKACEQMKEVIAIQLAEGEDLDSIRTYFVAQYGPQVLGEPPREGFNWLAWILPFVVLAIGGYILWMTIQRMTRPTTTSTLVTAGAPGDIQAFDKTNSDKREAGEYEAKLAEELKRYD